MLNNLKAMLCYVIVYNSLLFFYSIFYTKGIKFCIVEVFKFRKSKAHVISKLPGNSFLAQALFNTTEFTKFIISKKLKNMTN